MASRLWIGIAFLALSALPPLACGADLYVGAGAGQSRLDTDKLGLFRVDVPLRDLGWTVMAGVRPIRWLGAEVSYVDLGRPDGSGCAQNCASVNHLRMNGGAAFALLYLPLPQLPVDLYIKPGIARLHTRGDAIVSPYCPPGAYCIASSLWAALVHVDTTDTHFAWGGGLQANAGQLAFRAEYERFQTQLGHPELISAAILWNF